MLHKLKKVVYHPRLDCRTVSEGVDSSQRSADDAKVRVDFEGVLVVLVGEEGGDALGEGVHGCAEEAEGDGIIESVLSIRGK